MTLNTDNQHSATANPMTSVTAPVANIDPANDMGIPKCQAKKRSRYILTAALNISLCIFFLGVVCLGIILAFASRLHMKHERLMEALNGYNARTCGS